MTEHAHEPQGTISPEPRFYPDFLTVAHIETGEDDMLAYAEENVREDGFLRSFVHVIDNGRARSTDIVLDVERLIL